MKKQRLFNLLATILLVLGVLVIFKTPLQNWLVSMGSDDLAVTSVDASTIKENQQKEASFDFEEVEMLDFETVALAQFNSDQINVLGGMSIPSVGLNLPIGKGTSPYTVALTAGTMKEEQVMGEGNYALAGHHMKDPDLLFSPLYRVEIGDAVYLTDLTHIYEYQISEQREIEATDVHVIENASGKTQLTLITCHANGITRMLTVADFVDKIPVEDASAEMLEAFDIELSNQSG